MNRNLVKWKTVKCKNDFGEYVPMRIATIMDIRCRGTLLSRIISMPRINPISFASAIRMARDKKTDAFNAGRLGDGPDEYGWYDLNFVDWISSLGFHIELSGDEFESFALSDKII